MKKIDKLSCENFFNELFKKKYMKEIMTECMVILRLLKTEDLIH